jgi:hypothetical protein
MHERGQQRRQWLLARSQPGARSQHTPVLAMSTLLSRPPGTPYGSVLSAPPEQIVHCRPREISRRMCRALEAPTLILSPKTKQNKYRCTPPPGPPVPASSPGTQHPGHRARQGSPAMNADVRRPTPSDCPVLSPRGACAESSRCECRVLEALPRISARERPYSKGIAGYEDLALGWCGLEE